MSPARLRLLLLASVALNLFLLGVLAPGLLRHPFGRPGPFGEHRDRGEHGGGEHGGGPLGPGGLILRLADDLPPADAEILRNAFRPDGEEFKAMTQAMGQQFDRLRAVLRAEPFDAGAMRRALAEGAEARDRFERRQREALIDAVSRLSPEARKRMADWSAPVRFRLDAEGPAGGDRLRPPSSSPVFGDGPRPPPGGSGDGPGPGRR